MRNQSAQALVIDVDHHSVEAFLRGVVKAPHAFTGKDGLQEALRANKIGYGLELEAIAEIFDRLKRRALEVDERVLIAKGRPPEPGLGGRIEFEVSVSDTAEFRASEKADAKIDFRNSVAFSTVNEGDLIARLIPPTQGEAGVSLSGRILPTKPGKPAKVSLGEGARLASDGVRFLAARQGRPAMRKGQICVLPVLDIPGDVDLRTGNITFDGHVIVSGSVQDGATIECGSLHVRGSIGAATIDVVTDLKVDGGINGKGEAKLTVSGEAKIGYANAAHLYVQGPLTVSREVVGTVIRCEHRVTAGKLMGGDCTALLGLVVAELGSSMGVETRCHVGVHPKTREIDEHRLRCAQTITDTLEPVLSFLGKRPRFRALPEKRQSTLRDRAVRFDTLKSAYSTLCDQRRAVMASLTLRPVPQVLITGQMFSNVFICSGPCSTLFTEGRTGRMVMAEQPLRGTIAPAPMPRGPITRPPQSPNDGTRAARPSNGDKITPLERKYENYALGLTALMAEQEWIYVVADPAGLTRRYTVTSLVKAGCERIVEARSAAEAISALQAAQPHPCLMICEAELPGASGLKIAGLVKASPAFSKTRVIIASADTRKREIVRALQAGACDFLARPFAAPALLQKLERQGALPAAWVPLEEGAA